jgi:hypothetical protein
MLDDVATRRSASCLPHQQVAPWEWDQMNGTALGLQEPDMVTAVLTEDIVEATATKTEEEAYLQPPTLGHRPPGDRIATADVVARRGRVLMPHVFLQGLIIYLHVLSCRREVMARLVGDETGTEVALIRTFRPTRPRMTGRHLREDTMEVGEEVERTHTATQMLRHRLEELILIPMHRDRLRGRGSVILTGTGVETLEAPEAQEVAARRDTEIVKGIGITMMTFETGIEIDMIGRRMLLSVSD